MSVASEPYLGVTNDAPDGRLINRCEPSPFVLTPGSAGRALSAPSFICPLQFSSSFRPTHGHTASSLRALIGAVLFVAAAASPGRAEDGYRLWLRYERVDNADLRQAYRASVQSVVPLGRSATLDAACDELREGLQGLLGHDVPTATDSTADGAVLVGTISSPGSRRCRSRGRTSATKATPFER